MGSSCPCRAWDSAWPIGTLLDLVLHMIGAVPTILPVTVIKIMATFAITTANIDTVPISTNLNATRLLTGCRRFSLRRSRQ